MRIAFDLDGVLADLESLLAEAAERMFPSAEARPAAPDASVVDATNHALEEAVEAPDDEPVPALVRELTANEQRRLWQTVLDTENFWESLNETEPGIVARIATLALERRWEVTFVTQRPASAGDLCQRQSQRWLARHGFPMPSVFVIRGSRGKVAAALDLDVVVDDRPDNCLDVVLESKARAMLVWRKDASAPAPANARRLNIEVVRSVSECLDLLTREEVEKAAGLLGRLKRLIGS